MVGENKRYGSSLTRGAVNEFLVRPRPISLSPDELDGQDVVEAAGGDVVNAWVRYPEVPVQVTGRVVAFTDCGADRVPAARRRHVPGVGVGGSSDMADAPFLTPDDGRERPVHQWSPPQHPDVTLYTPEQVPEDERAGAVTLDAPMPV